MSKQKTPPCSRKHISHWFKYENTLKERKQRKTNKTVSCFTDDDPGLWSPVSHLSCEIWWNDTLAVLNCQDPVAVFCIIHAKLMNCPFFFFCVNCAAAHCIFSVVMVHLTIPAAANRWRNWVRPGRRLWGRSRYFHGSEKQKSRGT